jgi:hypothetical protein
MVPWVVSINMGWIRLAPVCNAPDCPVCTRQCSVPRLARPTDKPLSGKTQRSVAIIHRTVRCASNCPVSPQPTVNFANSWLPPELETDRKSETVRRQVAPDYPVRHRGRRIQRSTRGRRIQRSTATHANGRVPWQAPDNEQCRVRCAPDCPVHPSTESCSFLSNGYNCSGGYKYNPNHLHLAHPSIQCIHIQYKSKEFILRHIQSFQSSPSPTIKTRDQ